MSDNVEELNIAIQGNASSVEKAFDRALSLLDTFARKVDSWGDRIERGLSANLDHVADAAKSLAGEVSPLLTALAALTNATDKLRESTDRAGQGADRAASGLSRLKLEYQAGLRTSDQYREGLERLEKQVKEGSDAQLHIQRELRRETERTAAAAQEAARKEAEAAEKVAQEEEKAARRIADARRTASNQKWSAAGKVGGMMANAGQFLTRAVSVPIMAGGALSVKVTVDYDKAFNEVKKFTKATAAEFTTLQADLRKLSLDKTVGTDFEDLAHIAAFGSQLGIARQNLREFTTDVAYLGKAGDISGEQGATGLAKMASAMQLPQTEVNRLASSLVSMGEQGSSTLGEILDTAKRFASEARLTRLDPSQVFAYANAVTSLGQEAEAGGSSLMKIFEKVDHAVNTGGKSLTQFANVAGMSAREFATAYRQDAGRAVAEFLTGLDKQAVVAGRTDRILSALEITEVREKTAVRNLAAGHKLLAEAMDTSATAYKTGDEHKKKAEIASKSFAEQLAHLQRELKDTAFEVGQDLVPALLDAVRAGKPIADTVRHLAQEFHNLSPEAQQAWIKFGLLLAVAGPLLTGLGNMVGVVVRIREVMATLQLAKAAADLASIGGAAATAGVQMQGAAAGGVAAFAAGAPLMIAIVAVTAAVIALGNAWWQVKTAQDQAAQSAKDYTDQKEKFRGRDKASAITVRLTEIGQERSAAQDKLNAANAEMPNVQGRYKAVVRRNQIDAQAQLDALSAEEKRLLAERQQALEEIKKAKAAPPVATPDATGGSTFPGMFGNTPYDDSLFDSDKKKKGKAAPTFLEHVPLIDLKELIGKDLGNLPTDARTYRDKRRDIDLALAEERSKQESAGTLNPYSFEKNQLSQQMLLADNAIRNTAQAITSLKPKILQEEEAVKSVNAALNAQIDLINRKRKAGEKVTKEDNERYTQLRNQHKVTLNQYKDDKQALDENEQVNRDARGQKTQDLNALTELERRHREDDRQAFLDDLQERLKASKITRQQYEDSLREKISSLSADPKSARPFSDALTESETTRNNAGKELHKKSLLLDKRDFDALREELDEELTNLRSAGVEETKIAEYGAARRQEITKKEFAFHRQQQEEAHKANLDAGVESVTQYRSFLVSMLSEVQEVYGQTSAEAAKLNLEIARLEFASVSERAQALREAWDAGTMSVQQYIVQLRELQGLLPSVSPQYRSLEKEIAAANQRIVNDAHRTADEVGGKFADGITRAIRERKSFGQAIRDMLRQAADAALGDWIKRQVSKLAFRVLLEKNDDKMQRAVEQHGMVVQTFHAAVDQMATIVDTFASAVSRMPVGGGGASSGGSSGGAQPWYQKALDSAQALSAVSTTAKSRSVNPGQVLSTAQMIATNRQLVGAASASQASTFFARVNPYVTAALIAYSIADASGIFKSKYRGFQTKEGLGVYSSIGKGDHTGLIDSGYSGVESMRKLVAQQQARQGSGRAQSQVTIASGAIVIHAQPHQDERQIAAHVLTQLATQTALHDSLQGNE